MKQQDRFTCIYKQCNSQVIEIWVDIETGVNYMFIREGFSGGLTPLRDAEGKVIISKEYIKKT